MLKIHEIYAAIEGETTLTGWPCTIVRMAGCNLRCTWCDTKYAHDKGEPMGIADIVERVRDNGFRRVLVTGGEPLMQGESPALVAALADAGLDVFVETNGTYDIGPIDSRAVVRLDIKTPSSHEDDQVMWENIPKLKAHDEVKLVIAGPEDYAWAVDKIREHSLIGKLTVNFTPELNAMQPHILAEWILDDKLDVRLNMQMHKIIWGIGARGV
jgi:7-carboxy-7-deazaguanine synthase